MSEDSRPEDATQTEIKQPSLSPDQVRKWLSRAKTASKIHRKEMWPKYRQAKKRYSSEIGYIGVASNINAAKAKHNDINLLKKSCQDFIGSIFFRNPSVDLIPRNEEDDAEVLNIENLEQSVNDDIKDRDGELKAKLRSLLVDEYLSAMGAVYIDYDYRDTEAQDPIIDGSGQPILDDQGQPQMQREMVANKVLLEKIRPENIIRPPWINYYNYKTSPYLGFVDIVPIECLKTDPTLDQALVAKIKGREYKSLIDIEMRDTKQKMDEPMADDILHAKIYVLFLKGSDNKPLKRLVIADDENVEGQALAYEDYDRGHGADDRGYPIHILQLNDSCEGFVPPSEAWISEPMLVIMDYIYEKTYKHVRRSSTKTFLKTGVNGMEKADVDKLSRNNDQEYIPLEKIPPGVPLESLIHQLQDVPLSQDHAQLFELAKMIYDQLSRQPSMSKPSVLNKKKTATETEAITQSDNTENGDYIDKFQDFLKGVFYDWAKLKQRNFQGTLNVTVEDSQTGVKDYRHDLTRQNLQGSFHDDIDVNSFLPPNKALKRQQVKEIIEDSTIYLNPLLKEQGEKLNSKKMVSLYFQNADIRNENDLFIKIPVRDIDRQVTDFVFHNVPFNPQELGEDTDKALGRLGEILGDPEVMANYESIKPGTDGPQGEIANYMRMLSTMQQQKAPARKPMASDVGRQASMLGKAQTV